MALAILRLEDSDPTSRGGHALVLDTGTNPHYRIHLGKEVRREEGFALLDGAYWSSPLHVNPRAGRHLDTRVRYALDASLVTEPGTLVQLETCRGPDGRGPAWSQPLRLAGYRPVRRDTGRSVTMSTMSASPTAVPTLTGPRMVPVRSAAQTFSRNPSIADLIGEVVRSAAPVVLGLLSNNPTTSSNSDPTANLFGAVLSSVLAALSNSQRAGAAPATPSAGAPAPASVLAPGPTTVRPMSRTGHELNRFAPVQTMIFGIDDALIGALAGPVLSSVLGPIAQALPQLINAANQQKLAREALTDKQITDLLSQVDRTTLLQQLMFAQNAPANPGTASTDLGPLANLLKPAATTAAPVGTSAPVRLASIDVEPAQGHSPKASKALLTMVTGPAVTRLGAPRVVFLREQAPVLRFRLDIGDGGPSTPLPRAILSLSIREPGGAADLLTRSERIVALSAGSEIKVPLTAEESGALPTDTDLEVLAGLRWRGRNGVYQATCSQTVVMASQAQVRDRGDLVGDAVELTDMNRFRSFWNKVWSSPDTGGGDGALPLWGLDVAMRYSVLVTAGERGNGLMAARLRQQTREQGLRAITQGRLKSGIEVAATELNKLLPLWPGEQPLSADAMAAFSAVGWRAGQGGDALAEVRLHGKRGTRGQLWVVPVLKLRAFTLATAGDVDPYGQVTATRDRSVHFPVVESIRILGLTSLPEANETGEGADVGTADAPAAYRFDGYDVVLNQLVGLDPAQPLPTAQETSRHG